MYSLTSSLAVVGLCLWALIGGVSAQAPAPPNIVLIISDDHHWADYGFMGHKQVETPRIDQLANQGVVFPHGYVPSSLCCPSLATIISGLYPHQNFITSNDPPTTAADGKRKGLNDPEFLAGREKFNQHMDQLATLPRLLAQKGYVSFQTGKWWQGDFSRGGFTHGMTLGSRHGDEGLKIGRETMQPMYDFVNQALADKKPFFLWYAPFMPHTPHTPPDRLFQKYMAKTDNPRIARYWAMIEWLDETCGELEDYISGKGIRENTIFVYVADNGWIQDPEDDRLFAPRSKQSQYDGGLRTPIILNWPGKVKPARIDELASSIDIAPTLLKAAGIEPTEEMQGVNLLDTAAVTVRKSIKGEIFTHDSQNLDKPAESLRWRWIIDGGYKLILPDKRNEPDAGVELYNLNEDLEEMHNLADSEPEKVKELSAKLDAWWTPEL